MFDLLKDISSALASYPSLKQGNWQGKPVVEGIFSAYDNQTGIEIDSYEVRIVFTPRYPFSFPLVTETGEKIQPRDGRRHIFREGHMCLGNEFDEARVCKTGITFKWFLDNILNPHLCREYVKETTGNYPTGERSHGEEGLWESFYEIFGTIDKSKVLLGLEIVLLQKPSRNDVCPCGSGAKYKNCHRRMEFAVLEAGVSNAQYFYKRLKKHYDEAV